MKILMINKYLMPKGGAETYVFELGKQLEKSGHEVQYFGMDGTGRVAGNRAGEYVKYIDFHGAGLKKLVYPFQIIYSFEARRRLKRVLLDFMPDIVHLNNFNYQLTPSVIYAVRQFQKKTGHSMKIVYTAHDVQLLCPNHMMNNPLTYQNCEKCAKGSYLNCVRGRCIHGSFLRSVLGAFEGRLYKSLKTYRHIDLIVCPSRFISEKLSLNPLLAKKCTVLANFAVASENDDVSSKGDYALYFGRYSYEKGIETLLRACSELDGVHFKFAGSGPLEDMVSNAKNVENVGFKSGKELTELIAGARFSVIPSQWYENCPFSVIESITCHTPVLGAAIGGIPELISENKTGLLFESGNVSDLKEKIQYLWNNPQITEKMAANCGSEVFLSAEQYTEKLICAYESLFWGDAK